MVLAETTPTWIEHFDVVKAALVALCLIIAWGVKAWIQSQTDTNEANLLEHKLLQAEITATREKFQALLLDVKTDLAKLIGAFEVRNHDYKS